MQLSKHRQCGASMSGIFFGLVVLALVATVAIKLIPHYLQFMTVKSTMNGLQEDPASARMGRKALLDSIEKKLYINDVRAISTNDFVFSRVQGGTELSVSYEVREPLFGNLDGLLTFSHEIKMDKQ